jgi:hypothetical protein
MPYTFAIVAIVWSDVLEVLTAPITLSGPAQQDILAYVNQTDLTQLGQLFYGITETVQTARSAQIYLAAHIAYVTSRAASGVAGPVASQAAGGLRRSYATLVTPGVLSTTFYGQMYLQTLGTSLAHGPVVC